MDKMKKTLEKDIETKLSELRDSIQNKIVNLDLFEQIPAYALANAAVRTICDAVEFHSTVEDLKESDEKAEAKKENKAYDFHGEIAQAIHKYGLEEYFGNTPDYVLAEVVYRALENFANGVRKRDAIKCVEEIEKTDEANQEEPKIPEPVAMVAKMLSELTGKPVDVQIMKPCEWQRPNEKKGKNRKFREKKNKKDSNKSNEKAPF